MMDCNRVDVLLDDLVDGELARDTESALHEHAVGCDRCATEIRAAMQLRNRLSGLPDRVVPANDLWPAIAARIGERRRSPWPRLAAVAAGGAGVMLAALLALQHPDPAPGPSMLATQGGQVVVPVDPGMQLAAQSMLDSAELDGGALTPEAIAIVRTNLEIIDRALREIATALELDPDNPQLQRELLDTYRGQANLLDYIGQAAKPTAMRTDL